MPYDPGTFGHDITGTATFTDHVHGYDPDHTTDLADNFNGVHQTLIDNDVYLKQTVDAEATARTNVDTTLQANIDAEAAASSSADSDQATASPNADTTLQANIDTDAAAR